MQGILPDASAFLVSGLPTRRWYSEAIVEEGASREPADAGKPAGGVAALPPKASQALAILLREVGRDLPSGVTIRLESNIPRGKGLSSSSTDVLSVLAVANDYLGAGLNAEGLYGLASRLEPTDPCLTGDIRVFHQHTGRSGAVIGLPPVSLLYFDAAPGRRVETLEVRRDWPEDAGRRYAWLLRRFMAAAAESNYALLFDAITRSAEYNQPMLPLPNFDIYRRLAAEAGAGLLIAHSGTIAGLLVRPPDAADLLPRLEMMAGSPVYTEHYSSPYHSSPCRRPCSVR